MKPDCIGTNIPWPKRQLYLDFRSKDTSLLEGYLTLCQHQLIRIYLWAVV